MKNIFSYEWCYETLDEFGDIIDTYFCDKLKDFDESARTETLCLIRNEGNEVDGLEDRLWAYVKDGQLPETFEDGGGYSIDEPVPERFRKELKAYLSQ
jgi:hypothetical protein